jgi:outer membrane lipoprotein carrier protein
MGHIEIDKFRMVGLAIILLTGIAGHCGSLSAADMNPTIDSIVAGIEKRYDVPGFTAAFDQESILKAMQVTDTASGVVMIRQPGQMRWEYQVPDPQTIITDGDDLWVVRPQEKQVLEGKAPSLFGGGKGAGFLSNIETIRKNFQITLEPAVDETRHRLKLVPNQSQVDLMAIELEIDGRTYDLLRIITFNVYGDETRIDLKNVNFDNVPTASQFRFEIPEGFDVVKMNP